MKSGIVVLLALCIFGPACHNPFTPSIPVSELLAAETAVDVDLRTYTLEVEARRDFMPPEHSLGSDLMANVRVVASGADPFPAFVDSDRVWMVKGEDVWETEFSAELRPYSQATPNVLGKMVWGGPKWDVGAEVVVVVRLASGPGVRRLLRAPATTIGKTV